MSKIRFIQTNDIHWKLNKPEGRTDVYHEAIGAKLLEIFELANTIDAAGILIAGDLVDSPEIGYNAIRNLGKILIQAPCPIYAIAGQHDEWNHDPESLRRTPYGLVEGFGAIQNVASEPMSFKVGVNDEVEIIISGRDYDCEADVAEDYYEPNYDLFPTYNKEKLVVIHLAHGTVLTETPIFEKYTLVSQIKTSADVLCVGDYHPGIGIRKVGKTFVVNPGALVRTKATETEMTRPIQVSMIEIGADRSIDIKFIPLQCAMPGDKVLNREHLEIEKQKEEDFNEFLSMLDSEGDFKMQSDPELIEELAARENIPGEVKVEILRRIALAEEEIAKRQVAA